MKKTFTLALALFLGLGAFAQSGIDTRIQFEDKNGNVVPDGTTITITEVGQNAFGEDEMKSGLFIKNTSADNIWTSLKIDITSLPAKSALQACFPGNCMRFNEQKIVDTEPGYFNASVRQDAQTEWFAGYSDDDTGDYISLYGDWTASLQIMVQKDGAMVGGPKVLLHFVRLDPTGINDISADNSRATVVARYTAGGQLINAPVKGLNILKLSNGKTIKQIVK